MLTTPLNFQESLAFESWKQQRPISKNWENLDYKESKIKYILSEKILYHSDGHTLYSICESRDYILGVAMSNDDKNIIIQELKKVKNELEIIFEDGVKEYSIFFRTMNNFQSSISQEELHILLPRMAGEFVSTVIKGIAT